MQYTENYQFRKPVIGVDDADVKDINFNSDRADTLIHNTQISLAPAYDLNETYNTGDVVMYETLMYKCKEDNVTGAWVPEKWERTTAGEEGSGGGGGSSVVPNPQGEPTDTLRTIGIDGTVFDIAGSGGGGSARKLYKKLYNGNITSTGDLTLLDSIENYDFIMIEIAYLEGEGNPVCGSTIADVAYLKSTYNNNTSIWIDGGNNDRSAKVAFSDGTTMKVQKASTYDAIIGVYGLDLNGGAGDASEIISISAGDGTTSRTFTFDKTPKSIQFYWEDPVLEGTGWIGNGSFVWGQEYITFPAHTRASSVTGMMGGCAVLSYGADGKSVTINGANAFQSLNTPNGSGLMFVEYGGAGGSEGETSEYIPYSNKNNIVCEATLDNFDASSLEWGDGESPIILSQTVSMYNDEAVSIPVNTGGVMAYSDVGGNKQPYTAYMVCKAQTSGAYTRILSALESHSTNMGAMVFGTSNINIGSWNNSTPTGLSATSDYIVCAIQYTGYGLGYCKVNNIDLSPFPLVGSNRYITIGRTDTGSGGDQEPCDILVKYFGVVEGMDTRKAINENVAHLMDKFGIN